MQRAQHLPPTLEIQRLRLVHRRDLTALHRGLTRDGRSVLVEVVAAPRDGDVERLGQEFELMRAVRSPAVLEPLGVTTQDGYPALVFEDFAGTPLSTHRFVELREFLRVAERMAAALEEVHRAEVIHRDLKPDHFLVDPTTADVKLLGFGLATRTSSEAAATSVQRLEGSLPYMSPEQTGRMNRAVDSRSDVYSLGIVLFEMLTGRLPFEAFDRLEWGRCHVVRMPPSPRSFVKTAPDAVANIVLKCLAKRAEDRYQTARGLAADLARCRAALNEDGRVESFALGARDVPDRLQASQALYGRQVELAALERAFDRVLENCRPELVVVSGEPGVGKSSLVHELARTITEKNGSFFVGKFAPYRRDRRGIPNLAIAEAFRAPVRELLGESDIALATWREHLADAIGPNGRLVTELVPELELVLGPQPPVPSLGMLEDEQRFCHTFTRFVATFLRNGHPIFLFLDDLEWTDEGSLRLLEHLLTDVGRVPLVVVCAFRDDASSVDHPMWSTLDRVRALGQPLDHIRLQPLSLDDVTELVADTLRRAETDVRGLAELLFAKTGGSPFFVVQFMHELATRRMLFFDDEEHAWR
ncbi:MAG TPA: AAA family ATPase, partial [Labilithrix sp.]|nr:AAA family ATPase [Labilithrix sp.]